jgi:uncharacterized protein
MVEWIGIILTGIIAGVMSGLFGIGGGVIIVPVLIVFLGFSTVEAISTSLAALLMPVGFFAALTYYRQDLLDVRASAWIAGGLMTTSALGAMGALEIDRLDPDLMKQIYGVFLLVMAWRFMEPRKLYARWQGRKNPTTKLDTPPLDEVREKPDWYWLLLLGLIAGVFSGLFGIGGGLVIVPALVAFFAYDQKHAVGTSLGALLLPVGLPGVIVYANDGVLDLPVAMGVAAGLVLGAFIGARVAINLSSAQVKQLYGLFLLINAIRFIFF